MLLELIIAQLVAKNPGVSKTVLGLIAKKLADKVTEESQIEGAIADFEKNSVVSIKDYADLLQTEGDKRVSDALKKAKSEPAPDPTPKPKPADPTDVASIVAAEIAKALAPIQSLTAGLQNKAKLDNFKIALKAKGVPEDWADDIAIGDDFDQEATITKLETRWNNTKQAIINKEVDEGRIFRGSGGGDNSNFEDTLKTWNAQSVPTKETGFNIQEV